MNLQNVLHAEIAYDLRGNKELRNFYRIARGLLVWENKMNSYVVRKPETFDEANMSQFLSNDDNMAHHIGMVSRVQKEQGENYYFPKDFLLALAGIDRDVPLKYLPDNFWGYFQFAENSLSDDGGPVTSAYVYVGKSKHHHSRNLTMDNGKKLDLEHKIISVSYVNKNSNVTKFMWPLDEYKMSELFNDIKSEDTIVEKLSGHVSPIVKPTEKNKDDLKQRASILIASLNAVLYIASEDPELLRLLPEKFIKARDKDRQRSASKYRNQCMLPLIIVNHVYKADERRYSTESAWWNTHPRWQPCGPNRSQVKLIWVKGHEKKFK